MKKKSDITLTLPTEYFDALSEVLVTGLQRAKINPQIRNELIAWWKVEKTFIEEEIKE